MTDEGKKLQQENIKKSYKFLKEEGMIKTKDDALNYIFRIGQGMMGQKVLANIEQL